MFPLDQVPELARGAGVLLQKYRDGKLADAKVFRLAEGLTWPSGRADAHGDGLAAVAGRAARRGSLPPNGFPKSGRFS